jgi:hypothetical protein
VIFNLCFQQRQINKSISNSKNHTSSARLIEKDAGALAKLWRQYWEREGQRQTSVVRHQQILCFPARISSKCEKRKVTPLPFFASFLLKKKILGFTYVF